MIDKTISNYKIIEEIGSGGMGIVYKAKDTNLNRYIALKFLPPELTRDNEARDRFLLEAQSASALDHPNICTIYEISKSDNNRLFIAMGYYEGETLKEKIAGGPLNIEEAIDIITQIAKGLAKAHEKGIVHRDIKPANILITNEGIVKILDFGLAKLSGQTQLTKEGSTFGTVDYMSPEQISGEEVDHRTDIWSLGIVYYEMITGKPPFQGDYEQTVIYSIMNEDPEPITALQTGVPIKLERVITKCLQKSPANRYQHIDELVADLRSLKSESENISAPIKKEYTKKRIKTLIVSSGILLISIFVVVGYFFIFEQDKSKIVDARTSKWENSIAVLPFADLSPEKNQGYFCDGMTEQIISNLAKLPKLKVISRTSVMRYKNANKSLPEIGKELNVEHLLEGSIRKFGNQIRVTTQLISAEDDFHVWTKNYDRDYEELFDVQNDISQAIASNLLSMLTIKEIAEIKTDRPNHFKNYDRYMQAYGFHNKFIETQNIDYLDDAIRLLKEILKLEPDYLSANIELADTYNTYYEWVAETEEEKSRYMQLQKNYINIAYNLNPNSNEVLAVKMMISQSEQEVEYFSEINLKNYIERLKINPNEPYINWLLGSWFRNIGLVPLSFPYLNIAVEVDPIFTFYSSGRALAYFYIGEYEKAELDFKKALEIESHNYENVFEYIYYLISFRRIKEAEKLIIQWQDKKPEDNNLHQVRAWLFAVRGDKENALSSFNKTTFYEKYWASTSLVLVYLLLNDQEKAIELIIEGEKDYSSKGVSRSSYFRYLNLPRYKILHNDPRFQDILAKHKKIYEKNLAKYGDIDL